MIKIMLILVYLWKGEVVVERKLYSTPQECAVAGGQRMQTISTDPSFGEGYFAGCLETKVKEA
jgi:hypothetical protein